MTATTTPESTTVFQARDEDVVLWYCPDCSASGALVCVRNTPNTYAVIEAAGAAHHGKSPTCAATPGSVQLVRPNGWCEQMQGVQ